MLILLLPLGLLLPSLFSNESKSKPFGIEKRIPWTTSKVKGSPEPPSPYRDVQVFPGVRFDGATDLALSPLGDRWFVAEHMGKIWTFENRPDAKSKELFLDLRQGSKLFEGRNIWSVTFHPKFRENGYLYVCYYETKPAPNRNRISRFTLDVKSGKTPIKGNADSESIICEWQGGEDHWGGCLKFGKDGYLYFSAGDGNGYADGAETGQDLSDFNASILRIDVDHPSKYSGYSVPKDNPFVDLKGAKGEIWAYGLRNVWKLSFDRETGDLWAGDVGQDLWDPVYRIEKGGNYGWSVTEGSHPFRSQRKVGPTPILKPVVEHDHSEARSITGGFVYRGKKYPDLVGAYVYGDYDTGIVWGLKYDGKQVKEHRVLVDTPLRIVGFAEDLAGELYLLDYQGTIHQLVPVVPDPNAKPEVFPKLLSETGLFQSTKEHLVAPGVIPYSVNSPLWSDGAEKFRFMAIPGEAKIQYHPLESWAFPEGTVLVKTFALEMEPGNPKSLKRLETRLMHLEQNHWRGYTYLWNDEQTDAELLGKASLDREYTVGGRKQVWHFPSRAECTLCHTMPAKFVLGLSTPQMNRDQDYHGIVDNQLRTLTHAGLFANPPQGDPDSWIPKAAKLVSPVDEKASLNDRARSYLHANCAHCHMKWGGGNALFWLTWNTPLEETRTINIKPQHGDDGIPGACVLVPGQPEKSLLLHRMTLLNEKRMPRAGSNRVDEMGVKLIREWIQKQ
jgi:uncharacterized repeat protein (TIGR03806 family)